MRKKDNEKYKAISSAAMKLITDEGFHNTSMSKIAKAANISSSTIYVYFENKEDMLNKLYIDAKKEMSQAIFYEYDSKAPIKDSFKKIWNNYYKFLQKNSSAFNFCEQFANSPLINNISKNEAMKLFDEAIVFIERGKNEKVFKDISFILFHAFALQPIAYLFKMSKYHGIEINENIKDEAFNLAWEAIRA